MLRRLLRIGAAALAAGVLFAPVALASEQEQGDGGHGLAAVRDATAKFHSTSNAVEAGYGPFLSCFDLPGVGGMGQHYVDASLLDATLQPTRPEALVYEIDGSKLKLVAVEYIVPWSAWVSPEPPRLFGQTFYRITSLHVWALHAWVWRHNPLGVFANYNPNVRMCPAA